MCKASSRGKSRTVPEHQKISFKDRSAELARQDSRWGPPYLLSVAILVSGRAGAFWQHGRASLGRPELEGFLDILEILIFDGGLVRAVDDELLLVHGPVVVLVGADLLRGRLLVCVLPMMRKFSEPTRGKSRRYDAMPDENSKITSAAVRVAVCRGRGDEVTDQYLEHLQVYMRS